MRPIELQTGPRLARLRKENFLGRTMAPAPPKHAALKRAQRILRFLGLRRFAAR